jgi:MFS family permease
MRKALAKMATTASTLLEQKKMKPKTKDKLSKKLRTYYVFRVLTTMNFIAPVFMLFLLDRGLSSFQVFVSQAVYMMAELLLMVPAGAFADKFGRKKALVLSNIVYAVSFVLYAYADSFVDVIAVELLFAACAATFCGATDAFLYDMLAEAKQEKRYQRVLGTVYALQAVMAGLASVVGGWLAKQDLGLPFLLSAVPASLSMVPLLMLKEPDRQKQEDASMTKLMKDAALFVAQHAKVRNVMYYVAFTGVTGFVGWMLLQPMLTGMGMKVEYLGVVMMLSFLARALGNKLAHVFDEKFGKLDLLLVTAGFKAVLYLLVYLASGYYLVAWVLLFDLVGGLAAPIVSEQVNRHSKSENRATVLALSSMSGSLAVSVFSPMFGLYVDAYSEQAAYLLMALMLGAYSARQLLVMMVAKKA